MRKKISIMMITIFTFILLGLRLSFCQAGGVNMENNRKQILKYAQKGEAESAIKLGEEYLKNDPENIEVLVTLSECYIQLGKFAKAKELLKKSISVDAQNAWVIKTLAKTYRAEAEQTKSASEKNKLLELAQVEIDKVLKLEPKDAWANAEAALIYFLQGKKDEAGKMIKKAITAEPSNTYIKDIETKIKIVP